MDVLWNGWMWGIHGVATAVGQTGGDIYWWGATMPWGCRA